MYVPKLELLLCQPSPGPSVSNENILVMKVYRTISLYDIRLQDETYIALLSNTFLARGAESTVYVNM